MYYWDLEEPDGSEVFCQETDQEVYFYVNALDDSDMESDDTMLVV